MLLNAFCRCRRKNYVFFADELDSEIKAGGRGRKSTRTTSFFFITNLERDRYNYLSLPNSGSGSVDWSLAIKSLKNLPFVFCLQILFLTVQYCNKPHDSTDIYHAIHCCFPCLYISGMSDLHASQYVPHLTIIFWMWTKAKWIQQKIELDLHTLIML